MAQAPIPADWAYLSGRVTYNGNYQDGVTVSLPGGEPFTTKDGGYYKIHAYPNIAVNVVVSYKEATLTRAVETGGEGSNTTYNFNLVFNETPVTVTPTAIPQNICLQGTVMYDDSPLPGVFVQISPVTKVKTDMTGQYMATVPFGQNLTISVVTPSGTVSRNVTSPTEGTSFVVNLNSASPAPTVTATPAPSTPTSQPATPTAVPAGSESIIALSAVGLMAAVGLIRLRKE